ncbi:MAG: hypothetical protein R3E83_22020, partial [Burkholderiaceae bacterium]
KSCAESWPMTGSDPRFARLLRLRNTFALIYLAGFALGYFGNGGAFADWLMWIGFGLAFVTQAVFLAALLISRRDRKTS